MFQGASILGYMINFFVFISQEHFRNFSDQFGVIVFFFFPLLFKGLWLCDELRPSVNFSSFCSHSTPACLMNTEYPTVCGRMSAVAF